MTATGGRDTRPEMALRRALHRLGLRYRVHRPVPGAPRRSVDIAFGPAKVAVLVHGCYWHGCPDHARPSATNPGYWGPKIAANKARDADTERLLRAAGWLVLPVWEHEDPDAAASRIAAAVRARRASARER
jgi:DNA mismatch endonuclease (patch repair protein)